MSKVLQNLIKNNPDVYDFMLDKIEGEPYEVFLKEGYSVDGIHAIAGDTVKDVLVQASFIERCNDDCFCRTGGY